MRGPPPSASTPEARSVAAGAAGGPGDGSPPPYALWLRMDGPPSLSCGLCRWASRSRGEGERPRERGSEEHFQRSRPTVTFPCVWPIASSEELLHSAPSSSPALSCYSHSHRLLCLTFTHRDLVALSRLREPELWASLPEVGGKKEHTTSAPPRTASAPAGPLRSVLRSAGRRRGTRSLHCRTLRWKTSAAGSSAAARASQGALPTPSDREISDQQVG